MGSQNIVVFLSNLKFTCKTKGTIFNYIFDIIIINSKQNHFQISHMVWKTIKLNHLSTWPRPDNETLVFLTIKEKKTLWIVFFKDHIRVKRENYYPFSVLVTWMFLLTSVGAPIFMSVVSLLLRSSSLDLRPAPPKIFLILENVEAIFCFNLVWLIEF